ncbi:unnamed protein product [Macrosiphum euphorbiae]|uniref:Uncharacterized protein n=1 Tax=Macrosiphum euphorbiae TaxID=13131 RepID=A0AAV0XBY3_9HEMI|nr:unnamed protein product [Macrosiphum euphorbiae]
MSTTEVSGCDAMTGVCDASTNCTAPNRLSLPVCKESVWKINQQMKILEVTGDLELCPCLRTSDFRKMTKMMCHEYFVDDFEVEMTEPVDSMDLLVAMFNGLKLNEKREIKESKKEHFVSINTSKQP